MLTRVASRKHEIHLLIETRSRPHPSTMVDPLTSVRPLSHPGQLSSPQLFLAQGLGWWGLLRGLLGNTSLMASLDLKGPFGPGASEWIVP